MTSAAARLAGTSPALIVVVIAAVLPGPCRSRRFGPTRSDTADRIATAFLDALETL